MGKQVVLYLADSTVNGVITIDVMNWAGNAFKIPRTELDNPALPTGIHAGVYFLMCDDETTDKDAVYIGESCDIKKRLKQHIADYKTEKEKFYWHTAVVFTSPQLTKTHTLYIENALRIQAQSNNNCTVLTKATTSTKLDIGTQDSCDQFISEVKMLLGMLKYKIYDETTTATVTDNILHCTDSKGTDARGYVSSNGFTVLKGSQVSKNIVQSFTKDNYYKLRCKLEAEKIISDGIFTKDYDEFKSPSAASSVVLGRSSNGKTDWKTSAGISLGEMDTNI